MLADDVVHWVELALHKLGKFIQGVPGWWPLGCEIAQLVMTGSLETPGPVSPQEWNLLQLKFGNGSTVGS